MKKHCYKCKTYKYITEFNKDASKKSGYHHKCKQCDIEKEHFRKNQKKQLKNMKYPSGTTISYLYTNGNRLYLDNKSYTGWYHIIGGQFFTEKLPGKYSKPLKQYPSELKNQKPLDPNKKYFVKKINEGFVRSIGINEFEQYKNNPLYKSIEIDITNNDDINKAKELIPEISKYL